MKKLLAMLLVLVMVFSLTACGPNTTNEETTKATEGNSDASETTKKADDNQGGDVSAKELMKNVNARKAIAYAFDKSYITEIILNNGSKVANYIVPTNLAISEDGTDFRAKYPDGFNQYDPEKAKEHWNKAKEELGFSTATIEFLTYDSESSKKISEYIQGQLQDTLEGLTLNLNQQPFKNKLKLADEGQFELEFAGWGPDYPDAMTFLDMWVTGGGHNTAGYSSATYDENIKRTKTGDLTTDLKARTELLQETEKMLLEEDAVLIPIYQKGKSVLQSPEVDGILWHSFGGDFTYKDATTTVETDGKKIIRLIRPSDIPTMDTNKATNQVSFLVMANVLEGLTTLGAGDVVEPSGATEWTVSEDKKEYIFKLRKDSKWSNGEPVTAKDYVYSWRRLADPATASQYQFMVETAQLKNYAAVMAGEAPVTDLGVEAVDDYTLKVNLEIPVPYFLKLMWFANFYPVNEKFVTEQGENFGTTVETTLYNGPYTLTQWDIGYGFAISKNEDYWNAANVKNDGVSFRIIKDTAAGVNLYETNEADRAGLSGEFVEQFSDHPHFKVEPEVSVFYLVFNINNQGKGKH